MKLKMKFKIFQQTKVRDQMASEVNSFFFFNLFYLFIFLGCVGSSLLRAGFLQLRQAGATLHCGARASHCGGFSCCGAQALGTRASVVVARGLSSCGSQALEHRVSSCGAWAQLLRGKWDLPRPGLEPIFPALAGRLLTIAPPGKPQRRILSNIQRTANTHPSQTLPKNFRWWNTPKLVL